MENDKTKYYEAISFLSLSQIKGIGFSTLKRIARQDISFYEIFNSSSFAEFKGKIKTYALKGVHIEEHSEWEVFRVNAWKSGLSLYKDLSSIDVKLIFKNDDDFPSSLKIINDPPQWLFVQGSVDILSKPSIAIVGTRNPTDEGLFLTRYISLILKELSYSVVSGLAQGIDQAIHNYSTAIDIPNISILGTGFFVNYPANSEKLREEIIRKGGAIVTEYLPNQNYSAANFVKRNRLQAGLADIVVPVEWKFKSGTAHTVNYAKKFNKLLICLKLTTWDSDREEFEYAKSIGASVFTIPGSHNEIIEKINAFNTRISTRGKSYNKQLTLFKEDSQDG